MDTLQVNDPANPQKVEILYRSLFEHMLEGLAYCQMIYENDTPVDFVYLEVNEMFEKLSGLKNVVGKKITEIIPDIKASNPELFDIYGRVAKSGQAETFETFSNSFGGWLSVSVYSPENGYFIAVFENITERKKSVDKLKEMELRYRTLFEGSPYGVVIFDPETTGFVDFNEQVCKQLGYTREEFATLHVPDIEALENAEETRLHVQRVIEQGRDDFETKHRTKLGEIRDIFVIAQTAKIDGRLLFHCIYRDITEQKAKEKELEDANAQMKKMLELMTGREIKMVELKDEIQKLEAKVEELTQKAPSA